MPALPLLRSPPFPWVTGDVAAVSVAGRSVVADADAVFAAIRSARVGGAFWSGDGPWDTEDAIDDGGERGIVGWLAGRPVSDAAGTPVSHDRLRARAIAALESAAYRDPFTGAPIDALGAVAILACWRRLIEANRPIAAAVGMAAWKREAIAQFLWYGIASPRFASPSAALARAQPGQAIAYWPSRTPDGFAAEANASGVATWQVEDGFLRSAGLGVECRPPMSILVDRTGGIHFDPSHTSEVEMILADHSFDDALLARARRLRETIIVARLGKYGVDRETALPPLPEGRRIVLAVGQVADDLSVLRGGGGSTDGFLARVRAAEPDAYVVYRPHPDVVTRLRRGDLAGADADLVVTGGSLLALVERADAVHVLSSLTGFEALLRGVPVVVHGSPFYAGWGLTTDLAPQPARRTRRLTLDALVAGALIVAPRYRDPETTLPCEPEVLVRRLAATARPAGGMLVGMRKALGATRRTFAPAVERRA